MDSRAQAILDFWFGPPSAPDYGHPREEWFEKDPDFDAAIRHHFLADYEKARDGAYDAWQQVPVECLALVILLAAGIVLQAVFADRTGISRRTPMVRFGDAGVSTVR